MEMLGVSSPPSDYANGRSLFDVDGVDERRIVSCGWSECAWVFEDGYVVFGTSGGHSFDLEVLYLARKRGMTITEVPVEWIDAPGSTVDPGKVALQFLKDLVRIRTWSMLGAYRNPRKGRPTTATFSS